MVLQLFNVAQNAYLSRTTVDSVYHIKTCVKLYPIKSSLGIWTELEMVNYASAVWWHHPKITRTYSILPERLCPLILEISLQSICASSTHSVYKVHMYIILFLLILV